MLNIKKIISSLNLDEKIKRGNVQISLAVINLSDKKPKIIGYKMNSFIYPASLYKIFIAAEVLRQIETGKIKLNKKITVKPPNTVDKTKEIPDDPRPLLKVGDKVSVEDLLDLMIARSDNTAANCLIDLVTRENINKNIIKKHHWRGSEVTRKFLPRELEKRKYKKAPPTLACARHIAEFFYLVERGKFISAPTSQMLKDFFARGKHLINDKIGLGLPNGAIFYRKGGWLDLKLESKRYVKYNSDAGIVETKNGKFIIAILTVLKTSKTEENFPMKKLFSKIYKAIKK